MMISHYSLIGLTVLMGGLLIEALIFRAIHGIPPSMSKLLAIHHSLFRLLIAGTVDRDEPHFAALYRNVNILIAACRTSIVPAGMLLAEIEVRQSVYLMGGRTELSELPRESFPAPLEPILLEFQDALKYIVDQHFRIDFILSEERRKSARIQRAMATALLKMMPDKLVYAA